MVMTLLRILEFSVVSQCHPQVLGRPDLLGTQVRKIHVAESAEVSGLLEGGEVILCSGLTLRPDPMQISDFLARFADAGASGVIFSFLSEDEDLKKRLAEAASSAELPVVLLDDRARFVSITDSVEQLIKSTDTQQSASTVITEFLASASADRLGSMELFHAIADLLARPLVLVNSLDEVVAHQGLNANDLHRFLPTETKYEFKQSIRSSQWVGADVRHGQTTVGTILSPPFETDPRMSIAVERFAELLSDKLPEGALDLEKMRRTARTEIVSDLRSTTPIDTDTARLRAAVLGIAETAVFVPAVAHLHTGGNTSLSREASSAIRHILDCAIDGFVHLTHDLTFPVLLCTIDSQDLGFVLCLPEDVPVDTGLSAVESAFGQWFDGHHGARGPEWVMGAADAERHLGQASARGLDDALRVARAAVALDDSGSCLIRPVDLGFHWLAQGLVGTDDAKHFVRDQLGPALDEPEYLDFIRAYILANGNVTEVARTVHLSRPRVYARIRRIEEDWGLHLDDAEVRTSLHLALTLYRLGALEHSQSHGR